MQNCSNCGEPRKFGDRFCSNCGRPFEEPTPELTPELIPTPQPSPAEPPPVTRYAAWEDRQKLGFFNAIWETWKESTFYPNRFFSRVPFNGGIAGPLLYALIIGWVSVAIYTIYEWIFAGIGENFVRQYFDSEDALFRYGMAGGSDLLSLLIAPIFLILLMFVESGIYHLIAMIFGWAKHTYEATFRAVAYGSGPFMFVIVPFCGGLIGAVWALVITIIGVKHMQETSGGKATLVVLLPWILCCCAITIMALIFGAALIAFFREFVQSGYNNY